VIALQGLTPERLAASIPWLTSADARRVAGAVQRGRPLAQVRGVLREKLDALAAVAHVPSLAVRAVRPSRVDPFVKYVFEVPDGWLIEAVRIPLLRAGRYSACVSSQVGCALGCGFCATGRLGLTRNLEAWEIVEQVRRIRADLDRSRRERVHGVVFQGMGEPLANLDAVLAAIEVFRDPSAFAIDARAVTVCTVGIPGGIRRLMREAPKVRLAVSLGSARPEVRRRLMPVDRAHPLAEVLLATAEHARETGLAPLWAVTLLCGVNDGPEDARALAALAREFAAKTGVRPRVTIIPYNPIGPEGADPFRRADRRREDAFRDALRLEGVFTHKRYSGGADVGAACGQLAGRG
jgi:23S rRNA (adenine2503-C2)-methyltransferase